MTELLQEIREAIRYHDGPPLTQSQIVAVLCAAIADYSTNAFHEQSQPK